VPYIENRYVVSRVYHKPQPVNWHLTTARTAGPDDRLLLRLGLTPFSRQRRASGLTTLRRRDAARPFRHILFNFDRSAATRRFATPLRESDPVQAESCGEITPSARRGVYCSLVDSFVTVVDRISKSDNAFTSARDETLREQ
jgi:hypothetical protein